MYVEMHLILWFEYVCKYFAKFVYDFHSLLVDFKKIFNTGSYD